MDALLAMIDRGRHTYRNFAVGLYAAAGCVVAIVAWVSGRDFYKQGPMVLVGMLVLLALVFHLLYRRLSWERHPVLIALRTAPDEIERAAVLPATGMAALNNDRQVVIGRGAHSVMLTYHRKDLPLLARLLTDYCKNIVLDGFTAR